MNLEIPVKVIIIVISKTMAKVVLANTSDILSLLLKLLDLVLVTITLYSNIVAIGHNLINRFLYNKIGEEGRGYLTDLKTEWKKAGLTQSQVNKNELVFILDHYWGNFIAWLQLPRILSSIKIR
jgi:hypothetical protein